MIIKSKRSMLAGSPGITGTGLTQADVNLLKLLESSQRDMKQKRYYYKQLGKMSKLSQNPKESALLDNFVTGDKTQDLKHDQRLLSNIFWSFLDNRWKLNNILKYL